MTLFRTVPWNKPIQLKDGMEAEFYRAGHTLGASLINLRHGGASVTFSGDLGRQADPLFPPPDAMPDSDYLVVESTYGGRKHADVDPGARMGEIISKAYRNQGVVLIPSFAVGRTQSLLYKLWELREEGMLPDIPIFVDSPMAPNVTGLHSEHSHAHSLGGALADKVFAIANYVRDSDESRLLSGFQAEGTRGASLAAGADRLKIPGDSIPVNAGIETLGNFSAHADAAVILRWMETAGKAPKRVFITHGEPVASDALRTTVEETLGWKCVVPEYLSTNELED